MWHDQLLLTFLSTLCSFCSLSFHFFSFCLSSDKCRVQLKSEYPTTISHQHPPTSPAVPMPLLDSGTFPRSFWLDSARGSRDTAYLSTFPNVSNADCSSGSIRLACCLMSSPNPGRRTPGQTSHRSCKGSEQQMVLKNGQHYPTLLSQRCPAWDVLAYQPRWQNDVKPWSSKPWRKSQNVMVRDVFLSATSLAY